MFKLNTKEWRTTFGKIL